MKLRRRCHAPRCRRPRRGPVRQRPYHRCTRVRGRGRLLGRCVAGWGGRPGGRPWSLRVLNHSMGEQRSAALAAWGRGPAGGRVGKPLRPRQGPQAARAAGAGLIARVLGRGHLTNGAAHASTCWRHGRLEPPRRPCGPHPAVKSSRRRRRRWRHPSWLPGIPLRRYRRPRSVKMRRALRRGPCRSRGRSRWGGRRSRRRLGRRGWRRACRNAANEVDQRKPGLLLLVLPGAQHLAPFHRQYSSNLPKLVHPSSQAHHRMLEMQCIQRLPQLAFHLPEHTWAHSRVLLLPVIVPQLCNLRLQLRNHPPRLRQVPNCLSPCLRQLGISPTSLRAALEECPLRVAQALVQPSGKGLLLGEPHCHLTILRTNLLKLLVCLGKLVGLSSLLLQQVQELGLDTRKRLSGLDRLSKELAQRVQGLIVDGNSFLELCVLLLECLDPSGELTLCPLNIIHKAVHLMHEIKLLLLVCGKNPFEFLLPPTQAGIFCQQYVFPLQ
mmetsp:Transcript_10902/g.27460  ORF Transcript_10902/g.27460 Transcript_10902/m.27460 type:complete len:494 (+) Transcript_10902:183-1664(+)